MVFAVVLLLVLLVGADRVALVVAERGAAAAIQRENHLTARPDVTIGGFPLLTQVVRGRYERMDTTITGLPAQDGVRVDHLQVRLRGVHLPLSALLRRQVDRVPADRASATGTVGYAALNAAARNRSNLPGVRFTLGPGSHGRLAVRGTYDGAVRVSLDGEASVSVRGRSLVLSPVASSLGEVPEFLRDRVLQLIGTDYRLPPLPFGFVPQGVGVGPAGVTVRAVAHDVVLG